MLPKPHSNMAFVDIETTGLNAQRDHIIEVAVIVVDDGQHATHWHSLIQAPTRLSATIQNLTGIDDGMLAQAPTFESVAPVLYDLLKDRVFVAHNVRFDYAFLKKALGQCGYDLSSRQLCTLKLSKWLFPQYPRHSLSEVVKRLKLEQPIRHRALADATAMHQFWQWLNEHIPPQTLQQACQAVMSKPSLPVHLNLDWANVSNGYGVYLIYGDNDLPLYVGKSKHVKTRLMSHFGQDVHNSKEMRLSQQAKRIDVVPCAGEVDALITESQLIKSLQPLLNRQLRRQKNLYSWHVVTDAHGYDGLQLVNAKALDVTLHPTHIGLFHTKQEAHAYARHVFEASAMCLQTLQLEKGRFGQPCFRFQLKKCQGACTGRISAQTHNQWLHELLSQAPWLDWPFISDMVVISEQDIWHVIARWVYLGKVSLLEDVPTLAHQKQGQLDKDIYQILFKHRHLMQAVTEHKKPTA